MKEGLSLKKEAKKYPTLSAQKKRVKQLNRRKMRYINQLERRMNRINQEIVILKKLKKINHIN